MIIVICLLIAGALWYLGYGMGYERGERRQKDIADEYRNKYCEAIDARERLRNMQEATVQAYQSKCTWAVDRYDDLLDRYMQLKETLAKVVDENE